MTLEEAHEFLRLIQQSEFKVVEQLNKTPARISLLELLINFEPHRALLMKVLNDAHVAHDISVEGFEGIVNHITTNNYIAFAEVMGERTQQGSTCVGEMYGPRCRKGTYRQWIEFKCNAEDHFGKASF